LDLSQTQQGWRFFQTLLKVARPINALFFQPASGRVGQFRIPNSEFRFHNLRQAA
jgi:hypothetical protein